MEVALILGLQDIPAVSQNLNEFMYEKDLLFLTSFLNSVKKSEWFVITDSNRQ